MLQRFKKEYRRLKASPPGQRFQELQRRRAEQSGRKPWLMIIGIALLLVGLALVFLPGPGLIFIVVGLGLFAQEFPGVARGLDTVESWLRRRFGKTPRRT